MAIYPYHTPHIPWAERRAIRASKSDRTLPNDTKEPREFHVVWEANNDMSLYEINHLHKLFKNKKLEGLTGLQGLMDTKEVLTALLAYRKIPIKLLARNIPDRLKPVVKNTMINLIGVVYWRVPHGFQMKIPYLKTISSSISISTQSKVY